MRSYQRSMIRTFVCSMFVTSCIASLLRLAVRFPQRHLTDHVYIAMNLARAEAASSNGGHVLDGLCRGKDIHNKGHDWFFLTFLRLTRIIPD